MKVKNKLGMRLKKTTQPKARKGDALEKVQKITQRKTNTKKIAFLSCFAIRYCRRRFNQYNLSSQLCEGLELEKKTT